MKNSNQQIQDLIYFSVLFFALLVVIGAARLVFQELQTQPFGGYLVGGTFARPIIGAAFGLLATMIWRFGWRKMEQVINSPADKLSPIINKLTDQVTNLIVQVQNLISSEEKIQNQLNLHLERFDKVETKLNDHEVRIRIQENKDQ